MSDAAHDPFAGSPPPADAELLRRIGAELKRATVDRHHAWRSPVLASVSPDGTPSARTVVLRQAVVDAGGVHELHIYTDRRSPKVQALQHQPQASLLFWSPRLNWQLRVSARVSVALDGPLVDSAWARVGVGRAAGDYLAPAAPGAPLDGTPPTGPAQHQLAVLVAQVSAIDWLALHRDGHRRARWAGGGWTALTP